MFHNLFFGLRKNAGKDSDNGKCEHDSGTAKEIAKERPSSLSPMSLPKSSVSSNENSQEDEALLELPSPISRHGSLVGDPQLPVPTEFLDVSIRNIILLLCYKTIIVIKHTICNKH